MKVRFFLFCLLTLSGLFSTQAVLVTAVTGAIINDGESRTLREEHANPVTSEK